MDVVSDTPPPAAAPDDDVYAPGDSALEVAARRGIGPLSAKGRAAWHGHTRPCVSCGQLVPVDCDECLDCGQDLRPDMLERMRAHAGPWYVHEHVRPFPGVTLERLVRQIRRGVLTATTIVRGPTTDHQWRFAGQTPGLSKHLGLCWKCQGRVDSLDATCRQCGIDLNGGHRLRPISPPEPDVTPRRPLPSSGPPPVPLPLPRPVARTPQAAAQRPAAWAMPIAAPPPAPVAAPAAAPAASRAATPAAPPLESRELMALSAAIRPVARPMAPHAAGGRATIAGVPAWWIVVALLAVLFIAMAVIINRRLDATSKSDQAKREAAQTVAPLPPPLPLPAPADEPNPSIRADEAASDSPLAPSLPANEPDQSE